MGWKQGTVLDGVDQSMSWIWLFPKVPKNLKT